MSLPNWPRAHGDPLFSALIRSHPEDFEVSEELGFDLSGDGEHDYLFIEKTSANTQWVSRQLAMHAEVPAKDVGFAGLKDRHAVTRQWFSVPRWNTPDWESLTVDGVRLLEQRRHTRKLRRGAHKRNHFRIVLRGKLADEHLLRNRLQGVSTAGVPNYFGEQRFGRDGANMQLADRWARGQRLPRHKRNFAISAARAFFFNEQLADRIRNGTWNRLIAGDMANLDGSGSVFQVEQPDAELLQRCQELDIHPTGTLFGDGSAVTDTRLGHKNWLDALTRDRVKPANRSLRMRVVDLQWSASADSLSLQFTLSRGAFATSVLREVAEFQNAPS
ncbi:MAG: tRNA pseudouridine(13) synthase TruD [Woeseiaceae bacterium]